MSKLPKLRGHHLICLHFYKGEGYDEGFISSLNNLMVDVNNKGVVVVDGPDDVCFKCPHLKHEKCTFSDNAEDEIIEMDRLALKLTELKTGECVRWQDIAEKLPSLIQTWHIKFCLTCFWLKKCAVREYVNEVI
ncbi:MAG: DUF1284 domain-containing protein [Thermodesulfovibrionales bacterium]|nr:DUF1284 domain-containing protein [Thermodesulfovibrionales bacterium]